MLIRTTRMCGIAAMAAFALATSAIGAGQAAAEDISLPILVPITGFLALEGTSQRNGALLALENLPASLTVEAEVTDTGTSPEGAVTAFERALSGGSPLAMVAPMLGTQMLAILPLAADYEVPLITISGTAAITEQGNPWIFRFFPGDAVVKVAHARYAVEEVGMAAPAIIYQTTAYGQSGHAHLVENLTVLGAAPVLEEGIATDVREMAPVLARAQEAGADGLILHLHAGSTALVIRQARAMGWDVPIVAGSAMHQPSTAALLEPAELAGVCAETGSSPISGGSPEIEAWAARYQERFDGPPDAFALAQYDAVRIVLQAAADGVTSPEALRDWLGHFSTPGLAMTYKSDGTGNMAHDAVIICYGGEDRVPEIVKRYENVDGVL